MSDENATPAKTPRTTKTGDTASVATNPPAESAEVVEVAEVTGVQAVPVEVTETEPVAATAHPDDVVTSVPNPQIVYVTAPAAPRAAGNRGFGALIALLASVLYLVLLALGSAVLGAVIGGGFTFDFMTRAIFYAPVLAFLIGFVLLVLIVNRAAWWTYIIGSILVGAFVYFATIGFGLLSAGIVLATQAEASELFQQQLTHPFVIISALLAREVSMWVGAGIAARGRRVKARNVVARETYDRELAEKRAEHERGPAAAV